MPIRPLIKLGILVIGIISLTYLPYALLGLWNRAFGGWRSVFFCYPGGKRYRDAYAPGIITELFHWRPCPIGILRQGDGLGLVLASPMTEAAFRDPRNAARFARFRRRLARIAWLMGVRQIHLAGVLPGVLRECSDLAVFPSRDLTAQVVMAAIARMIEGSFAGREVPLILLGGAGYLGRRVAQQAEAAGYETHIVDSAEGTGALPASLRGAPALLVDLARAGALSGQLEALWPELVVLNEVFPEPGPKDVARFAASGIELWHIAGVEGAITPPLPGGYAGAVPCCAAHDAGAALEPVLRRLTPAPG